MTSRWPKTPPPEEGPKARAPDSPLKKGAKKVASKALDASGPAISTATTATGTGTVALATGAAAASATGIGLVVVGSLATVGASAKSLVAATSSGRHYHALIKIHNRWKEMPCMIPPENEGEPDIAAHEFVAGIVLPYVISQKLDKYKKRGIAAIPVLGSLPVAAHTLWRAATKENKGVDRTNMAYKLAVHLVTHNCSLAQAMVAELFSSYEKMLWMLDQDTDTITPLIAEKMKSI